MNARIRLVALAGLVAVASGCGDVVRGDRSSGILNVDTLLGLAGGASGTPSGTLLSDVLVLRRTPAPCTPANPCPTIVDDFGQATLSLSMKNTTVAPTTNNNVTLNRYTVVFSRTDGRNTPGVDVPYPIDGALTASIPAGGTATVLFEMVRHTAKEETPLVQLVNDSSIISSIAHVTFYGQDLVGNAVTASGTMSVNFGNFADQ